MRLWSVHPRHLDPQGLVALWREGLLARKVLHGQTKGYRHHPQLQRFQAHAAPLDAIDAYLHAVVDEADARGYRFDRGKLAARVAAGAIDVATGQLDYERAHLLAKLAARNPALHAQWRDAAFGVHPLFRSVPGPVAAWERP